MKIRVYGFSPEIGMLPPAITIGEVLEALVANNGAPLDKRELLRASATQISTQYDGVAESWYAGMLIRAKEARSYNHLINEAGKLTLTARQLGEGKIAEISYFIANPATGNGLIAVYHGGPNVPTLKFVLRKLCKQVILTKRKAELDGIDEDDKQGRAAIYSRYKGQFEVANLMRDEDIKHVLKEFKRLTAIELRFAGVKNTGGYFSKLRSNAISETEKFNFAPDFLLNDELEDEIVSDSLHPDLSDAFIEGMDLNGKKKRISVEVARNKLIFGEEDYETFLGNLILDLDNWAPTIQNSAVVQWLIRFTKGASNRSLLTTRR